MTRKQLQALISAGVFSASMVSGAAYAEDSKSVDPSTVQVSSDTSTSAAPDQGTSPKHATTSKDAGQHGCSGANGCGGK